MKYFLVLILVLPFVGNAQQEVKNLKHEFQLTVGLDSYLAFEFEPSYSYMFHKNIGITGGIRFTKEVVDNLHYDLIGGPVYQWRISNKKEVSGMLLRPALHLKYPIINDWIFIVAEPGIFLNFIPNETLEFAYINTETIELIIPEYKRVKNNGGRVLSYDMKTYISIAIDNWAILCGYDFSTFDLYSGRRNIIIEGDALNKHLPSKTKLCHTGFVGVTYFF